MTLQFNTQSDCQRSLPTVLHDCVAKHAFNKMASQLRCQASRPTTMASQMSCETALLVIRLTMGSQLYCAILLQVVRLSTTASQLCCITALQAIHPTTMASQLCCATPLQALRRQVCCTRFTWQRWHRNCGLQLRCKRFA